MKTSLNKFSSVVNPKRMMGAAIAEYLPLLSLVLVICIGGVLEYSKKIRTQAGIITEELAGFGDPRVVSPGSGSGGSGSGGSGGVSDGGGSGSTTAPPKPDPADGGSSTVTPNPTTPIDPIIGDGGGTSVDPGNPLIDDGALPPSTDTPGPVATEDDSSVFDSAAAFFDGLWTGLKSQFTGLLEMVLHPIDTLNGFKELAIAFATDPAGTTEILLEEFKKDVEKIKSGDPRLIGEVIGENISPAALASVVSKLRKVSKAADVVAQRERIATKLDKECSGSSFLAGTLVWSEKGLVPIETLDVGDLVFGRDETKFADAPQRISELHGRDVNRYYELDTGYEKILVTEEHPFWQQGKGWVAVAELVEGDVVARAEGDIQVHKLNVINGPARVYNFTVEETHSYFVGPNKLWVHNIDCPIDFGNEKPTLDDIAATIPTSLRKDFEADFKDEEFAKAMMADPDLAKAWTAIHGKPTYRKDVRSLESVKEILNSPNLKAAGLNEESLAKIVEVQKLGGASAPDFGKLLDNLKAAEKLAASPTFHKVIDNMQNPGFSGAQLIGANFTLKFLKDKGGAFDPERLIFEEAVLDGARFIDVTYIQPDSTRILFELKSVKSLPTKFGEQFTNDLVAADSLEHIKWTFESKKDGFDPYANKDLMLSKLETALGDIDEDRLQAVAAKLGLDSSVSKESMAKAIADEVGDQFNDVFEVF